MPTNNPTPGLYVCLEGADATGKTTMLHLLQERLQKLRPGLEVIATKHPGSTPLGAHIRRLVKNPAQFDLAINVDNVSAQVLMTVDHLNFRHTILLPALERGAVVLADRSNLIGCLVYGQASGLSYHQIGQILNLIYGPRIDRLFVLTCNRELRRWRQADRRDGTPDKFEDMGESFSDRVAALYESLVTGPPEQAIILNRIVALENVDFFNSIIPPSVLTEQLATEVLRALEQRQG